jgi:ferric-dicitrate binding protein FerR (iron transport regulator)
VLQPFAIAAGILIAVAAVVTHRSWSGNLWRGGAHQEMAMREVATPKGTRAHFTLPDGSRIALNAGSQVRYAADFGTSDRSVYLQGEAYFEVKHDAARPFRVHTSTAIAEDLGTEFIVRAYPDDRYTNVAVKSGLVALSAAADSGHTIVPTLRPGDVVRVDSAGHPTLLHRADIEEYLAWTRGSLRFERVPVRDVMRDVARWYDLDIQLTDSSLQNESFTAEFEDRPADAVLTTIARVLHLRFARTGRSVVFYKLASSP